MTAYIGPGSTRMDLLDGNLNDAGTPSKSEFWQCFLPKDKLYHFLSIFSFCSIRSFQCTHSLHSHLFPIVLVSWITFENNIDHFILMFKRI